jgi:hypothetical protein
MFLQWQDLGFRQLSEEIKSPFFFTKFMFEKRNSPILWSLLKDTPTFKS